MAGIENVLLKSCIHEAGDMMTIDWNRVDWLDVVTLPFPPGSVTSRILLPATCLGALDSSPLIEVIPSPCMDQENKYGQNPMCRGPLKPISENLPVIASDDGGSYYQAGYLYQKKHSRTDGSTILYCSQRVRSQCRGTAELSSDGQMTLTTPHNHAVDPEACANAMAKRAFREQSRNFEENLMKNVLGQMYGKPYRH